LKFLQQILAMSDDDSFADGIRELLRNHNLSSSSFIRCVNPVARIDHESSNRSVFLSAAFVANNVVAGTSYPCPCHNSEEDIIKGAGAVSR
jgi:hypothetical protein